MQTKYLCVLIHIWIKGETGLSPPVKYFTDRSKAVLLLWIFYVFVLSCLLCLCARLFICALWSPAGKGLTLALVCGVLLWVCNFPIGILGQVWYLIASIPDLCTLTYFIQGPQQWRRLWGSNSRYQGKKNVQLNIKTWDCLFKLMFSKNTRNIT